MLWRCISGADACRPSSSLLCGPEGFPLHRHDFSEVFWVSQGHGTHWINGEEIPLHPGVLVMMRPSDGHAFRSDARGVLVQNIAIRPNVFAQLKRRHFLHDDTFWNGAAPRIPRHHELNASQLNRLATAFDELSFATWDAFSTERFLLNLLFILQSPPHHAGAPRASQPDMPDWLATALALWRGEVKYFGAGTPALAQLAGRSPEHISRTLRECTGRTPTDYLNETRMAYAAHQLAVTNRKILDIAMECGFDSLGHFYFVFQKSQGCPPRAYRMRFQPRPI